jgi:hypothetical protein
LQPIETEAAEKQQKFCFWLLLIKCRCDLISLRFFSQNRWPVDAVSPASTGSRHQV